MDFDPPKAAYIHIPFCRRRCYYCDFPVSVVGDRLRGENSGTIRQYLTWLNREIALAPPLGNPLQTVFFGGGTPSLLSVRQVGEVLRALDQRLGIDPGAEISMEMDPGTFDRGQLEGYQAAGVNRISLGVQAFQPELLAISGRTHTVPDIQTALDLLDQAGVKNFSLDLLAGLPHQTLDQWQDSLDKAGVAPHLSCYDLTLEPVTAFGRQYQAGLAPLPNETTTATMYRLAQHQLTLAGYEHYEISNYARPGYQCHHNRVYWKNQAYYGFGMGAASYVQGQRLTRPRKTGEYYQWVEALEERGGVHNDPVTPETERLLDSLMLGFRLAEGIDLGDFATRFGWATVEEILACLRPYQDCGWVEHRSGGQAGHLRFRDPEGFLFSNTILSTLFCQLGDRSP